MADTTPNLKAMVKTEPIQLVFIHGFLDEGSLWRSTTDVIRSVSDTNIKTIDLPGMGSRAVGWDRDYRLETLRDLVLHDISDIHGSLVLVGHSMGCQVAELVAAANSHKVAGLVLLSPVPLGGLPLPEEMVTAMRQVATDGESQRQMRSQLMFRADEAKLDALMAAGLKVQPPTANALFDTWRNGLPIGEKPTDFAGPVLMLGGVEDGFSTPDLLESAILPRFPNAKLVYIQNAGHWPHVEQPASVAAAIDSFVTEITG